MKAQQRWTTAWYGPSPEGRSRIRLLIEGPQTAWFDGFAHYRARGYEVAVCTGPGPAGDECTLLTDGRCPLADRADVVLSTLDVAQPACRSLAVEHADRFPDRPYIVAPAGVLGDTPTQE